MLVDLKTTCLDAGRTILMIGWLPLVKLRMKPGFLELIVLVVFNGCLKLLAQAL
jgi:hypothetical protein